jgi:hypothetical protein
VLVPAEEPASWDEELDELAASVLALQSGQVIATPQ